MLGPEDQDLLIDAAPLGTLIVRETLTSRFFENPRAARSESSGNWLQVLMKLIVVVVSMLSVLHTVLQEEARSMYQQRETFEPASENWTVLLRAGGRWHDGFDNVSWRGQALPAGKARKCFLLHMSEYSDVVPGALQLDRLWKNGRTPTMRVYV